MKKQANFYGTIKDGKLSLQNPTLFAEFIKSFPPDSQVVVTVGKQYEDVTRNQVGYYFGVIVPRGQEHFGLETPQMMDNYFKVLFLTEYPDTEFERMKSKTELDSYEMSTFMERCIMFLAQEGVHCEPANKEWRIKKAI